MIMCAAIKFRYKDSDSYIVMCGCRHADVYEQMRDVNIDKITICDITEGFLKTGNEFLDRKQALWHALECGQLSANDRYKKKQENIDELYSEDLW